MTNVTIDLSKPLLDPSGSGCEVYPAAVEPSYLEVTTGNSQTIKFAIAEDKLPPGTTCELKYFRYQNPEPQYNAAWWKPKSSPDPGPWSTGYEFEDVTPSGKRGAELWIKDRADNDTLYYYVLQITVTDASGTRDCVLDPEIHNKE